MEENGVVRSHNGAYDGTVSVLHVKGYLDTTAARELDHIIEAQFAAQRYHIIVDLDEVEYVSSVGWGVFLGNIRTACAGGGELKLARMRPEVYEVYRVLEFDWFVQAHETLEEAVAAFSPPLDATNLNAEAVVTALPPSFQ